MCGIIGWINEKQAVNPEIFGEMCQMLAHRGPDGQGTTFHNEGKVALGHRRLSIIDLSEAGKQPMCNEDESLWLTFNGEIYNYEEIREELIAKGHTFHSNTDSEVILHGFEEWGKEILNRLTGMFAFGLWDEKKQSLFLARDRFGIKPLYYYQHEANFGFASELKALHRNPDFKREVDFASVCDFLIYRYVPSPKTIWKNAHKLPPAHWLEWQPGGIPTIGRYWEPEFGNEKIEDKEAVKIIDEILLDSHKYHLVADVPVGSFLSGGYDSSAMVYYVDRLKYKPHTFAIGFTGWEASEHQFAKIVADQYKTEHHLSLLGPESLRLTRKLSYFYDEPIGDISILPTYNVSFMAAKRVKTVMSGEGADEAFCGYTWQHNLEAAWKEEFGEKEPVLERKLRFLTAYYAENMSMGNFDVEMLKKVLHPDYHAHIPEDPAWFYRSLLKPELPPLKAIQYLDMKCFMGELVLAKVDRASMAHSLEGRVPFLDHRIMEHIFKWDTSVYYHPERKKHLLLSNLEGKLPVSILERKKQGFVGPDDYYKVFPLYEKELTNGYLVRHGIINAAVIPELIETEDHWRLWKLMVLDFWFREWVGKEEEKM